jgi:hypothetical protein
VPAKKPAIAAPPPNKIPLVIALLRSAAMSDSSAMLAAVFCVILISGSFTVVCCSAAGCCACASWVFWGWVSVGSNITSFKKGDIVVFPKTKSEFGHVCVWTGAVWVSDFVQKQLQPYNGANFPYTVYRAKKGYTNGQAVTASGGDYIGEDGVDENGNPISGGSESEEKKNAGEKLIDGMASLLEWAGDSDTMSAAVNWLDSIEKDKTEVRQMDSIDLAGFDNKLYGQLDNGHQYKYGNGGGVNEDTLFNPNLDRQKGASQDLLGTAGKLNGIQRQQDVGRNLLGEAGYVNPSMRQLGTKRDLLGEAGSFDPATRQLASKYDLLGACHLSEWRVTTTL